MFQLLLLNTIFNCNLPTLHLLQLAILFQEDNANLHFSNLQFARDKAVASYKLHPALAVRKPSLRSRIRTAEAEEAVLAAAKRGEADAVETAVDKMWENAAMKVDGKRVLTSKDLKKKLKSKEKAKEKSRKRWQKHDKEMAKLREEKQKGKHGAKKKERTKEILQEIKEAKIAAAKKRTLKAKDRAMGIYGAK